MVGLVGCQGLLRVNNSPDTGGMTFRPPDTPNELITQLNRHSMPIQAVECNSVNIDLVQNGQPFGAEGRLAFQKSRNFRVVIRSIAGTEADLGSNDREFWFYMKRNDPPDLFFCSYEDLPRSQIKLPVQPDWIAEALCVQELNANEYQMRPVRGGVELFKEVQGQNGERLYKGIVVATNGPNAGRVILHRLFPSKGADIWRADITEYHRPQEVGQFVVPRKVKISCPEHKVTIDMVLDGCRVNQLAASPELFQRPAGYRAHDIARMQATPTTNQIQRVRGSSE
jgi:hypothetical protein